MVMLARNEYRLGGGIRRRRMVCACVYVCVCRKVPSPSRLSDSLWYFIHMRKYKQKAVFGYTL